MWRRIKHSVDFTQPDWWDPIRALRAVTLAIAIVQLHLAETPGQHLAGAGMTVVLVYWYLSLGPGGNGK